MRPRRGSPLPAGWLAGALVILIGCSQGVAPTAGGFADIQRRHETQAALEYAALQDSVVGCLLGEGFDDAEVVPLVSQAGADEPQEQFLSELDWLLAAGDEEEIVAQLGFGFAPVALMAANEASQLSTSTTVPPESDTSFSEGLEEALADCAEAVGYFDPAPSTLEFAAVAAEIDELVSSDPELVKIEADWIECMSEAGFRVRNLETLHQATSIASQTMQKIDPLPVDTAMADSGDGTASADETYQIAVNLYGSANTWEELASLEIGIAQHEYSCRKSVSSEERIAAVRDKIAVDFVDS